MAILTLTPPTPFVAADLELTKSHCNVDLDNTEDDALLASYVNAAFEMLEGPSGYLGRFVRPATAKWTSDCFRNGLLIDMAPIRTLTEIGYFDHEATPQVLSTDVFYTARMPSGFETLWTKTDQVWPRTDRRIDAVSVTAEVGYDTVPDRIMLAVNLTVAEWYDARGALADERFNIPHTALRLLQPFRTNIIGATARMRMEAGA